MPTPRYPLLPQCSALAAQVDRHMFATWLTTLTIEQPLDARQADVQRLKGMLTAYLEMDLISCDQYRAMANELHAFAFGAAV